MSEIFLNGMSLGSDKGKSMSVIGYFGGDWSHQRPGPTTKLKSKFQTSITFDLVLIINQNLDNAFN